MPMNIDDLKKLVDQEGLRYYLAPDHPSLVIPFRGDHGKYEVLVSVQLDGQFLQLRTMDYLWCPVGHAHLAPVLQTLTAINYQRRFLKYGWDPKDGEIVAYGDMWLMDSAVTQQQLNRMFGNYLSGIDEGCGRLSRVLETGTDPGEPEAAPAPPPDAAAGGTFERL